LLLSHSEISIDFAMSEWSQWRQIQLSWGKYKSLSLTVGALVFHHPVKMRLPHMALGKVKSVVDSVYEFEDVQQAFEKLQSHRARGKIVIKIST
jgi:NADPH:quinone reductase-like Zn-dependent oxidoreductase